MPGKSKLAKRGMGDKVSSRVKKVSPSGIRKFFDLVMGMEDVISLGVGEPDFITPWHIREASMYALERGYTMYTSNYGMMELREEIARHLKKEYRVDYDPETEILVTVGVSEGFDLSMRAITQPGDEILIPEPSYVSYKPCTFLAGGEPVSVVTKVEDSFKVKQKELEEAITDKTKAIVLNYPNNPTGATMNKAELEAVAKVAEAHDLMVISDEVYDKLTYDGKHTCFASLDGMKDRTILLNGFSKAYAMTGWRIGYACGDSEIIEGMMKIHQYSMLCAPIMGQMAGIEALRHGEREMKAMVKKYDRRRKVILKRLNDMGLTCFEPKGAFYAFPSISSTGLSSEEFAGELLKKEKVAVVPGNAFGGSGEGFIRCAYAASLEEINTAMDRMEKILKSLD